MIDNDEAPRAEERDGASLLNTNTFLQNKETKTMSKVEQGGSAPHSDRPTSGDRTKFYRDAHREVQRRARTLRPLSADESFNAHPCSSLGVWFKVERSANGRFIVQFSDGDAVEVTDAQLRSEQRFRHRLRLKRGQEFTPQKQLEWSFELARAGVIEWTEQTLEYEDRLEEWLDGCVQEEYARMAGEYYQ
jgi:hypothetical protein